MKYKTKSDLQGEIETLKKEQVSCAETLVEFIWFLNSPKFRCGDRLDGYINVNDVQARVRIALSTLSTRHSDV